jgi:hypothetical protein
MGTGHSNLSVQLVGQFYLSLQRILIRQKCPHLQSRPLEVYPEEIYHIIPIIKTTHRKRPPSQTSATPEFFFLKCSKRITITGKTILSLHFII